MPVSDDEIRARFELNDRGQIVWKRIEIPPGSEAFARLMRSALDQLNAKAGRVVEFWEQQRGGMCVRVAGSDVYERSIRRVLEGTEEPKRAKRGQKAGGGARSAKRDGFMMRARLGGAVQDVGPFTSTAEAFAWLEENGAEWPVDGDGDER